MGALVTQLLQDLIRHNTVNPPGSERAVQEHLANLLDEAGFAVQLLGAEAERPNLVATLEGPDEGPTLGFLGHVDTVLADPEAWTRDPWAGDIADGYLWGRGALDMKSQVAAEVAAAVALAREGWRPARGELKILSVVDEETGGELGARWLCRRHPRHRPLRPPRERGRRRRRPPRPASAARPGARRSDRRAAGPAAARAAAPS